MAMRFGRHILFLMALGAVAFLISFAGCEEAKEDNAALIASQQIECVYNSDCDEGLVCGPLTGRCLQCYSDTQCPGGQRCAPSGACEPECQEDADCDSGECNEDGSCADDDDATSGEEFNPIDELPQDVQDWLRENGYVDAEGNFKPPWDEGDDDGGSIPGSDSIPVGLPGSQTEWMICENSDDLNTIPADPCAVVVCWTCYCDGVDSRRCQSALELTEDDIDDCRMQARNFHCTQPPP